MPSSLSRISPASHQQARTPHRKRRWRSWLAILASLALLIAPAALAGQQQRSRACRTGESAEFVRQRLADLMTGIDAETVGNREMYGLPLVPPAEVRAVTDDALCARAARAYYRHRIGPPPRTGVAVIRVGDVYAVYGDERAGEWTILTVFNRAWQALASVGQ